MAQDPAHVVATPLITWTAIDAVVFDIGGVFTVRHPEPVHAAMAGAGIDVPLDPARYLRAHHDAVRAVSDLLTGPQPPRVNSPPMWTHLERGYLRSLGIPEHRLDDAVQVMVDAVFPLPVTQVWRHVLPENVDGFRRIARAGVPVGIVSNNDGTAADQLRHFGVCQVGAGPLPGVAIVVDSQLVGVAKPDPAIFLPALQALGTEPARTLYVGDTVHADVHGATAAGMPVVQLDPYDLHADFHHARLPDVAALADLLLAGRCDRGQPAGDQGPA